MAGCLGVTDVKRRNESPRERQDENVMTKVSRETKTETALENTTFKLVVVAGLESGQRRREVREVIRQRMQGVESRKGKHV